MVEESKVLIKNEYVGLYLKNSKIDLKLPLGFEASDDISTRRNDIFLMIRLLKNKDFVNPIEYDDSYKKHFPITSYFYMIQDFFANGYYFDKIFEEKLATKGKINWKKTLKKVKPIISNDNFLYTNFIVSSSRQDFSVLLAEAYKYCLDLSNEKVGWIWNGLKIEKSKKNISKDRFLSVVNAELNNSFLDKKKELLLHMKAILTADTLISTLEDKHFLGTDNFYLVWEYLIDKKFGDPNKTDYSPRAEWILVDKSSRKPPMRLDSIHIDEKGEPAWVLDAKYYKYGVTFNSNDLPSISSIAKQIIYGEEVCKKIKNKCVYNAFLIPSRHKEKDNPYEYLGYAKSSWKTSSSETYTNIILISIDTKFLIANYNNKSKSERDKLFDLIASEAEKIKEKIYPF